ncbi:LITAF-like zinc ribbon domain-containing protein [Phthorimaea operculella]|nr:LITAF-like zinc ribbon domain-containing protein [Phthorimaea operculella]
MESGGVNPTDSEVTYAQPERSVPREAPPPYSPQAPGAVITSQPVTVQTVYVQGNLKYDPVYYTCHKCNERVFTKVNHVSSHKTHLLAGFLFGCTMWCLLCCVGLIPYVIKTFKTTEHYCPNCDTLLGTYSKI